MAIASRAIDDATAAANPSIPKNATLLGLLAHGGEWAARKGASAMAGATNEAARSELAGLPMSPGPVRDKIVDGLLAHQARSGSAGNALSGLLSNPATARGLLGYVDDQRRAR